jgi:hypothetical protein
MGIGGSFPNHFAENCGRVEHRSSDVKKTFRLFPVSSKSEQET